MNVPFIDLRAQFKQIEEEVLRMVKTAMENGAFVGGPQVSSFEEEFAGFCNSRFCVGVSSGTDALRFALLAAGVGPGDGVVTVPNTFIATTEAVSQVGARPLFVDVLPDTYNMDPDRLASCLRSHSAPRPRAVIPVHLYGQPAPMDPIMEIARAWDLIVIEDACQAHGAVYRGRKAGAMGLAGCFSFYPGKNLGAFGEAGAVVTNDEAVAGKIRMIRDHGQARKYHHEVEGYNGRLDAIQAGVLRIKLKRLEAWNEARRTHAERYDTLLSGTPGVTTPFRSEETLPVFHLYVILAENRDELQAYLAERNVGTGLHYPLPLHLQKAYARLGYPEGAFPVTENLAGRLLSLPMYPELTEDQIEYVADCVKEFMASRNDATAQRKA
jgi:dTDP-4-amino-4,6-dideoxygalactose transaminase